jgi:hypothetical protein
VSRFVVLCGGCHLRLVEDTYTDANGDRVVMLDPRCAACRAAARAALLAAFFDDPGPPTTVVWSPPLPQDAPDAP